MCGIAADDAVGIGTHGAEVWNHGLTAFATINKTTPGSRGAFQGFRCAENSGNVPESDPFA